MNSKEATKIVSMPDSEDIRWGTDELNLAEFPLGFLSDRQPLGMRTRVLEDRKWDASAKMHFKRRLIVTGSDAFGLPAQGDNEILMALFRIAELYNRFQEPKVQFRIHQVIRLLGWDNHGRSYRRVRLGMDRLATVGIKSERAWWDKEAQEHKTKTFSILDSWEDFERRSRRTHTVEAQMSSFVWSDVIFRSLKNRYTKAIDMELFRSLRSAIAKQVFRLLDKRFRCYGPRWEFDLREFAIEKLGLSGNYRYESEIQKKIDPALIELENLGVIASGNSYVPVARGRHRIVFEAGPRYRGIARTAGLSSEPEPEAPAPAQDRIQRLTLELTKRGVSKKRALTLLEKKRDEISSWEQIVEWAIKDNDQRLAAGKVSRDRSAGRLANTIEMADAVPKAFSSTDKSRAAVAQSHGTGRAQPSNCEEPDSRAETQHEREDDAVRTYLDSLPRDVRASTIEQAWANATPGELPYRGKATRAAQAIEARILRRHVLPLIQFG